MKKMKRSLGWGIGIALLTVIVFLPVLQGGFLSWDDNGLFVQNTQYRGLSASHWNWMCTTFYYGHWQPLSWLSYALDYAAGGMNPAGWHLVNLLLHALNAVLVYLLCMAFVQEPADRKKTAACAVAALFYAIHPLRVEVVAWLATRGYLLCTTFCLLTCLFYLRAVSRKRYPLAALLFFALAAVTKGIGMMLPLVLLLIDWFPLGRVKSIPQAFRCAMEKIPFFMLSLLTGVMAFFAKKTYGGMAAVEQYGPLTRFGQALSSFWFYLSKTVAPIGLSPLYDKPPVPLTIAVSLLLTAVLMSGLFLFRRRLRGVIAAVAAFFLLIFPMLGFTQSGKQVMADRFTYLAVIPFSVLLASGLVLCGKNRRMAWIVLTAFLVFCGAQTFVWSRCWSDDLALWRSAILVDEENAHAHNSAGTALLDQQRYEEALVCFERALEIKPWDGLARHNRALVLTLIWRHEEAFEEWRIALAVAKDEPATQAKILLFRGWAFEQTGDPLAAEQDYDRVIDSEEFDALQRARGFFRRGELFAAQGKMSRAAADWQRVLSLIEPTHELYGEAERALKKLAR